MGAQQPEHTTPPAERSTSLVPWLAALSVVLVVALVAAITFTASERNQAAERDAEIDALRDQVAALQDLTARQQEQLDEPSTTTPPPDTITDDPPEASEDSLGGDLGSALEDLLGEGLGDVLGDGTDLFGGADPAALAACVGGDGIGDLFSSGEPLAGSPSEQVTEIANRVAELRGLEFATEVNPTFLDDEAFAERVATTVREEYPAEQADIDSRMLAVLGAIPVGTDLLDVQAELLAGQVAGFYDPDTGELVVPDDGDGTFDATEQIILAHELDHALTDQALGLPDLEAEDDTDGTLARLALVEGDATLLMQQYTTQNLSLVDQFSQLTDPDIIESQRQLNDVPPYLRNELSFPYTSGLAYVCDMYADGSWGLVNADYQSLPSTTAEVLFPERGEVSPVPPSDPGNPGPDWEIARTDTIGAAQLLWLFGAPGGNEDDAIPAATEAAQAWTGGKVVVATQGSASAIGIVLTDGSGAATLCSAIDAWYDASFADDSRSDTGDSVVFDGGRQTAILDCAGNEVRLGIAPDMATATALVG